MRLLTLGRILAGLGFSGCLLGQQTTVTLTPSTFTPILGQALTLTATVSPSVAAGKVTFFDGAQILGVRTLAGGLASLSTTLLPAGPRPLRVYYSGGGTYQASSSTTLALTLSAVPIDSFLPPATYPTSGTNSQAGGLDNFVVGDFNGDGITDLAAVDSVGGAVSVLLGKGDGTFQLAVNYATLGYSGCIAIGDFNGDGKADLAVGYGGFAILIGNGDGTFQSPVGYPAGQTISWLTIADFNGDGRADIAVVNGNGQGISIVLGNGDGTFQAPVSYGTGCDRMAVAGDFNGDGKTDLAVINFSANTAVLGSVSVLLGNGDGTFRPGVSYSAGHFPVSIAVGDFNGDGKLDLAVGNYGDNTVSVVAGNGDGTFRPAANYLVGNTGSGARAVVVGDFNGDNITDLAVINVSTSTINILQGNGDGTFRGAVSYAASGNPSQLMAGDFNRDGKTDLAFAGIGGTVSVSLGTSIPMPTTTLTSSLNPAVYGQSVSLTATVTIGSGSVTFYDGATSLGTGTLASGRATVSTSVLTPGLHSLNVVYAGDANNAASYSNTLSEVVSRPASTSTTSLVSSGNPTAFGQTVTLTAQVVPSIATGKVTFYDGTSILGSGTLANGQATLTTGLLAAGTRQLTAVYSGDVNYGAGKSAILLQVIRAASSGGFQSAVGYSTNTIAGPVSVAVGDFNGDGIADLAVANYQVAAGDACVFLGNGDGTFRPAVHYPAGVGPLYVAVGDFNRDGKQDLVFANRDDSTVRILLGNGDGTFQTPLSYTVVSDSYGGGLSALVVGDFNSDGNADLIVVNTGNHLSLLLGNGDGTFQTPAPFGYETEPYGAAAGDFNGDGKVDLVVTGNLNGSSHLFVLLGNGDGTFQSAVPYAASAGYGFVTVGDFNGDGIPDLAVTNTGNNTIGTLKGNGDGTFQAPVIYNVGSAPMFIAVGDFNGDGNTDLAVANHLDNSMSVLSGKGDGTFSAPISYGAGGFPNSIAVGDFNGDGRTDLAVASLANVFVFLGKPPLPPLTPTSTTLASSLNPSNYGQSVTLTASIGSTAGTPGSGSVTFYDGSQVLETKPLVSGQAVLTTRLLASGTRSLRAYYSGNASYAASTSATLSQTVNALPSSGLQTPVYYDTGSGSSCVSVADLNGDGKPDIFFANFTFSTISVLLGNGDGTFSAFNFAAGANPTCVAAGDFNGDGIPDLAVTYNNTGIVAIYLGKGDGTFRTGGTFSISGEAFSIAVGDFNGDGNADLVTANWVTGNVSVLLGNGDGTFQASLNFAAGKNPESVVIGDFNGDGKPDLAVANGADNNVSVLLGNGDGTFQPALNYSTGNTPYWVAAGDFNGDGKLDLVAANRQDGTVSVLMGKGDGSFQATANFVAVPLAISVAVGDINGDGKLDLAVAGLNGGVSVLVGNGNGTFQAPVNYAIAQGSIHVAIGDFNGDGRADLAVSNQGVSVFLARPAVAAITLVSSTNPSQYGQSVTLTATASPPGPGNVTFFDGTTLLASRPLVNGQATLTTSLLAPGSRSLKAYYGGGSSPVLTQTVSVVSGNGFITGTTYSYTSASLTANHVAVGDFNGDGKADMAVASISGGFGIAIFLGRGDGTFVPPTFYAPGAQAGFVAVGDFNEDGKTDLAFTNYAGSGVDILLGNGDGSFQPAVTYPAGSGTGSIAVGDFNGDGIADLAVSNFTDNFNNSISVLLGNGDGSFQPPVNYSGNGSTGFVVVGDFNADGRSDLAIGSSGGIGVRLGNGDGTFQAPLNAASGMIPFRLVAGDFNRDGKTDLAAVINLQNGNNVIVLLGNGDGTFQPAVDYYAGPGATGIVTADFDGDGKLDLGVVNKNFSTPSTVTVLTGNGDGSFRAGATYVCSFQCSSLAVGEFNGDGRVDLAVAGSNSVTTLLGGSSTASVASKVGVFRANVAFLEDSNGNTAYDPGVDRFIASFTGTGGFVAGDVPVVGDWTGDGHAKVGIYRTSTGTWFLDANNNGIFDAGDYTYQFGGLAGDIPFAGDWNGLGKSCIGLYRTIGSVWLLDLNCNGAFENLPNDAFFPFGGVAGDVPVVGAWTGGTTRVGVVRKYAPAGVPQGNPFYWVLDSGAANAGSAAANHQPGFTFAFGGLPGDVFVTGDWYNSGVSAAGVYRAGFWVLDAALPGAPQVNHVPGPTFGYGGVAGDVPVVGKW